MCAQVLICGGGPAGLAAAIACRLQGFDATVIDCAAPSIDKACGEGLLPDAVAALDQLGVDLSVIPGAPFHGIRFVDGRTAAKARFRQGQARGVRRTHLHAALYARSEALGVRHLWRTTVRGLSIAPAGVVLDTTASPLRARWCIGADGLNSRVRLWAGLGGTRESSRRIGLRTHLRLEPWSDCMEVYWGKSGQAYVTPIAQDEISLAVIGRRRYPSIQAAMDEFPALASRIMGALRTSSDRGAATITRRFKRVAAGPVALLGDASGSVDAITGAGLGLAFQQALALAPALAAYDLRSYEAVHRAILRRPELIARGLLLLDGHEALRRGALAVFGVFPELFELLLAFHAGEAGSAASPRLRSMSPVEP